MVESSKTTGPPPQMIRTLQEAVGKCPAPAGCQKVAGGRVLEDHRLANLRIRLAPRKGCQVEIPLMQTEQRGVAPLTGCEEILKCAVEPVVFADSTAG